MSSRRVLTLIKGLGLGGAEQLLVAAAPHLDCDLYQYHIGYFLPWKDALVEPLTAAGLPVRCFDIRSMADPRAIDRVRRYVSQHDIDVIHAHLPWPSVIARAVSRLCDVRVIYTEHGCWDRLNPLTRWVNRMTFGMNDLAIAVSDDVAKSIGPKANGSVRTILNGIDCDQLEKTSDARSTVFDEFKIPTNHLVVAKVANLTPVKNHQLLVRAFAKFHQQHSASTLLLVGQLRETTEEVRKLARDLDIEERVVLTGPRTDVPRILTAIDIFAMSSRSEGVPISLLEAMALKRPVVCPRVGGIPGVVTSEEDGLLYDAGNGRELAEILGRLAENRELSRKLGDKANRTVRENFDIATMVRQVEALYEEVLDGDCTS